MVMRRAIERSRGERGHEIEVLPLWWFFALIFDRHGSWMIGKNREEKNEEEKRRVGLIMDYFGGGFMPLNRVERKLNPSWNCFLFDRIGWKKTPIVFFSVP